MLKKIFDNISPDAPNSDGATVPNVVRERKPGALKERP
jgi:hypothetical protein